MRNKSAGGKGVYGNYSLCLRMMVIAVMISNQLLFLTKHQTET